MRVKKIFHSVAVNITLGNTADSLTTVVIRLRFSGLKTFESERHYKHRK